jgi:hypothetical protein
MFRTSFYYMVFVTIFSLSFMSCKKETDNVPVTNTIDISVSSSQAGAFTYFSFEKGEVVTAENVFTTKDWDFGLKLISFQVNGGTDRAGEGGVIILDNTFENVTTAPETGYKTDNGADTAIKDEWYTYDPVARSFTPKAGKVFVFKTAKGKFAKMEVIKGVPTNDNGEIVVPPVVPTKIKYTIRYAFQADGSRNL